jgi:acyl carrier protein
MGNVDVVREFIIENFLFGNDEIIAQDTSFLQSGIIDSTGILELVGFLESTFEIKLEDEELVPENLDSLRKISRFLDSKLSGIPSRVL